MGRKRRAGRVRRAARLTGCCLSVAIIGAIAPDASALQETRDPKATATVSQMAYAANVVRIKDEHYLIIAGAERVTKPNGVTRTTAFAKRSKCATLEKKRITLIACATYVFPRRIPERAFEFDPLLGSARLRLAKEGERTRLVWRGRDAPTPDAYPAADPQYGAFAGADVYRSARADGRLIGYRYRPRRYTAFALLDEGAEATAYSAAGVTIEHLQDGALAVSASYRRAR